MEENQFNALLKQIYNAEIYELNLAYKIKNHAQLLALCDVLTINSSIHTLNLRGNKIGDAGAEKLAEVLKVNGSIHKLYLGSNKIGVIGVEKLAEALKVNGSIHEFCLRFSNLGDLGAEKIAEALKVNSSIHTLHLNDNRIQYRGREEIRKALKWNFTITFISGTARLEENDVYIERNIKLLEHSIEKIYNLYTNKSLGLLSQKDHFSLKTHKAYTNNKLTVEMGLNHTELSDFWSWETKEAAYNMFPNILVCKSKQPGAFSQLPKEIMLEIGTEVAETYKIKVVGEENEAVEV